LEDESVEVLGTTDDGLDEGAFGGVALYGHLFPDREDELVGEAGQAL
jgi:hypothetical protein